MIRRSCLRIGTFIVAASLAGAGTAVGALRAHAAPAVITCGPKSISKVPAPGLGQTITVPVAGAGTVTLLQLTYTALEVQSAVATPGWTVAVTTPYAHKVHVGFTGAATPNQVRFHARLDGFLGITLTMVTVTCA